MANNLRASIIVPVYNRKDDICALLESLQPELDKHNDVEVIVVDDGSDDGTPDAVRAVPVNLRVLESNGREGPARARNLGSQAAGGTLLIYLDSDGVVKPGWLDAMLDADDGQTVLLGHVVDFEGGRVQGVPRRATFLGKSLRCRPERANTGPSCNLAAPKACFDVIGGYDEEIPYYFEDSDFCIRAGRAGYAFRYLPNAVFRHKGNEIKKGDAVRMQERNSTYAMLKAYHRRPLMRTAFTLANGLWLMLRLIRWFFTGRTDDCARLWAGWKQAYRDYREKFRAS